MTTARIALAQTRSFPEPERNLETARRFAQQAAGAKADLLVFPEMFMALPKGEMNLGEVSEPLDGPFATALKGIAREFGLGVLSGLWESGEDKNRAYNTLGLFSVSGELLSSYRKVHLFNALSVREEDKMLYGNAPPPVVPFAGLNLGLAICYDLRFPELFRHLASKGADLVVLPSAWYAGTLKEDHWLTLLRARAIENTLYVAGANLVGSRFCGRSAVFDPFGVWVASAGENETLVIADVNTERVAEVREKLPSLNHARPELF